MSMPISAISEAAITRSTPGICMSKPFRYRGCQHFGAAPVERSDVLLGRFNPSKLHRYQEAMMILNASLERRQS
jgi:hypothetical protein